MDVVADFGSMIERDAWAFMVRSERLLPHPKAAIKAALYAAFADPKVPNREAVETGIWMLTQYATTAELSQDPETLAVWNRLQDYFSRHARGEITNEEALEATSRLFRAAGPLGAPRRLTRVQRRARAACWLDLLEHFPEIWPASSRPGVYLEWMYEHAGDVHETAKSTMDQLQLVDSSDPHTRTRALAYFQSLHAELGELVKEALDREPPPEQARQHETYTAAAGWVARNLTEYVQARLDGDRDAAAKSATQFIQMLELFEKWDKTYHDAIQLRAGVKPT
jgi:hypothetical protein